MTRRAKSKRTRHSYPPVESLSQAERDSAPEDRDWSEGYVEEWDYVPASRCDECREIVFGVREGGDETHSDVDNRSSCDGNVPSAPGPCYNKLYPLTTYAGNSHEAAAAIVDLPLCVVVSERTGEMEGLALTGAGMDLSWEIAEAYMRLGCLPPAWLRLPGSARSFGPLEEWIAAGMRQSLEMQKKAIDSQLEYLDSTIASGREHEKRYVRTRARRLATDPHAQCEDSRVCIEHQTDPNVPSCKSRGRGRRTS